jgi:hypothetical protein
MIDTFITFLAGVHVLGSLLGVVEVSDRQQVRGPSGGSGREENPKRKQIFKKP